MSSNYRDLMRYAQTGIKSADMTYYDCMKAVAMCGGSVQTLTGIPPLSFKADGKPLISWSMLGNGQQTGTPSPQSIIMPTFCGVRTGNLLDVDIIEDGYNIHNNGVIVADNRRIATTTPIDVTKINTVTISYSSIGGTVPFIYALFDDSTLVNRESGKVTGATIDTSNGNKLYLCWYRGSERITKANISDIMLNLGSTALPYEPYGWAEKITCAGQTVPVYLGQVQTVRRVKKLVLTGDEALDGYADGRTGFRIVVSDALSVSQTAVTEAICSHFTADTYSNVYSDISVTAFAQRAGSTPSTAGFIFRSQTYYTKEEFIQFLKDQYAAGTPVTVWYVLAEPVTAIVNEPLCKIGDYADELHSEDAGVTIPTSKGSNTLTVETDLQPSEMTITFKG